MKNLKLYDVILSPVITEKSTLVSEHNQFIFKTALNANKADIKAAIEAIFSVNVIKVNTLRVLGKTKKFRGRDGKRSDFKKAMVTLAEGQSIDVTMGI